MLFYALKVTTAIPFSLVFLRFMYLQFSPFSTQLLDLQLAHPGTLASVPLFLMKFVGSLLCPYTSLNSHSDLQDSAGSHSEISGWRNTATSFSFFPPSASLQSSNRLDLLVPRHRTAIAQSFLLKLVFFFGMRFLLFALQFYLAISLPLLF